MMTLVWHGCRNAAEQKCDQATDQQYTKPSGPWPNGRSSSASRRIDTAISAVQGCAPQLANLGSVLMIARDRPGRWLLGSACKATASASKYAIEAASQSLFAIRKQVALMVRACLARLCAPDHRQYEARAIRVLAPIELRLIIA